MEQGIVIAGRRVRFRFFFFLAIALASILFVGKGINKQLSYDTIKYGEITLWDQCTGLVIRQEKTHTVPDYGKVDFFVSKGQMVEKDMLLALLYKSNYNQELIENLYQTKQKISDYQNKNIVQEIIDSDFDKIRENINDIVYTMQYNIQGDVLEDMERDENQLRGLLRRRKDMLDKEDSTNNYLERLYEQEKDIEDKLDEWKVEIRSPELGMIGFDLDGLEDILTPNDIDYLTVDQYLSFIEHETPHLDDESNVVDYPLFKIVDPDRWYLASLIPHKNIFYEQGDAVSVKLLGLTESIVNSRVYRVDFSKDSTLVILEMTDGIESILEMRDIQMEIGTVAQGLMVPQKAIIDRKNNMGVKILNNGNMDYVEVKIQAMDDEWAIIEKERNTDSLEVNDKVLIP